MKVERDHYIEVGIILEQEFAGQSLRAVAEKRAYDRAHRLSDNNLGHHSRHNSTPSGWFARSSLALTSSTIP